MLVSQDARPMKEVGWPPSCVTSLAAVLCDGQHRTPEVTQW